MTWFKVDDTFHNHWKVRELKTGPCEAHSLALWLLAGNWAAQAELKRAGFVPAGTVLSYSLHELAAEELVRVGLWERVDGGYVFHDWADYQPSGDALDERRRRGAERKAVSRKRLSTPRKSEDVGESQRDSATSVCVTGSVTGSVTGLPRTESQGCLAPASRDRDRETSPSSSSEFSSVDTLEIKQSAGAREAATSQRAAEVISFRRPLPEPPEDFFEEPGPSDAEVRALASQSFTEAVLAVFAAPPGRPSDKQLDDWIDSIDLVEIARPFELGSIYRTAAFNWAKLRFKKDWEERKKRTIPKFGYMLECSPVDFIAMDSSNNPPKFRPVLKADLDQASGGE